MHHLFDQTNQRLIQSKLQDMLNQAQQEADTRQTDIAVCISNDDRQCVPHQDKKVIMFLNNYQDGTIHEHSQIIDKLTANKDDEIHMRAFPYYRHYLQYQPHRINYGDNATWWYCHQQKPTWALMVNQAGRTHIVLPDKTGNIHDSQGNNLECTA